MERVGVIVVRVIGVDVVGLVSLVIRVIVQRVRD